MPTSRTMRASPAISLGDSIRHTASIARATSRPAGLFWGSVGTTRVTMTTFPWLVQALVRAGRGPFSESPRKGPPFYAHAPGCECMPFSTCSFTASRLKEAGFWSGETR